MMQYAAAAFFVNLFCFVFVQGTYLNRYLILAVIFFVPVLAVVLHGLEKGRLRGLLLLAVCAQLALSSGHDAPRREIRRASRTGARART